MRAVEGVVDDLQLAAGGEIEGHGAHSFQGVDVVLVPGGMDVHRLGRQDVDVLRRSGAARVVLLPRQESDGNGRGVEPRLPGLGVHHRRLLRSGSGGQKEEKE